MDLLDYLDLEKAHKKYDRVRSWYLYEQYKSLERNQHDAAQRLKSKSCQDRILHQELNERKVRRRLCDQFDSCRSESYNDSCREEYSKTACADEIFVNFCELETDNDFFDSDIYNNAEYSECTEINGDTNNRGEIKSEEFNNIIEPEIELTNTNISESVTEQLEVVKENIEYLEEYTKLGVSSETPLYGLDDFHTCEPSEKDANILCDTTVLEMWSRLVAYAYQIIKLNHGANCYFDYSSQLLASVLMFDVMRRVVGRICYVLQPYVCPIKFDPSEPDISVQPFFHENRKNISDLKKDEFNSRKERSCKGDWQHYPMNKKLKFRSAPASHFDPHKHFSQKSEHSRAKFSCKHRYLKHVLNHIILLSRIIDDILEEVAEM